MNIETLALPFPKASRLDINSPKPEARRQHESIHNN